MQRSFWFTGLPYTWFYERTTFDAFFERVQLVNNQSVCAVALAQGTRFGYGAVLVMDLQTMWLHTVLSGHGYRTYNQAKEMRRFGLAQCERATTQDALLARLARCAQDDQSTHARITELLQSPLHPFHVIQNAYVGNATKYPAFAQLLRASSVANITADLDHA